MSDYNNTPLGSGYNNQTAINNELTKVETAVNSKMDKSGTTMTGDLDMNSKDLLNVSSADFQSLRIGGAVIEDGEVGPVYQLKTITSTDYTLVLSDRDAFLVIDTVPSGTITIPPESEVNFENGTSIAIARKGSGERTIVAGAGVTILTEIGLKLNAINSQASIVKIGTNTWMATGALKL